MKHEQYTIICGGSADDLTKQVTEKLTDGWELYGTPYAVSGAMGPYHYQAMVKAPQLPNPVRGLPR